MNFRTSRYAYWYGYAILLITIFLAMYYNDRAADKMAMMLTVVSATLFIILEYLIRNQQVRLTQQGIDVHNGLLRTQTNAISNKEITRTTLHQNPLKKALRYGDICIIAKDEEIMLKNIHEAERLYHALQRKI
ncbi:PH domain-containing protein [Candidatus Woesearchaeota archaeon]|nr:PH domain-containing protein [Candidatus Woesearchaeota archaeon]